MLCQVYKSPRQSDTYLYLPEGADPGSLPAALMKTFGNPEKVMDVTLDKNTKLAQANPGRVLQAIRDRGFYLQLPPRLHENKHDPWA